MQALITPYPKTGELDVLKEGMQDEATSDPEPQPWCDDAAEEPMSEDEKSTEDDPLSGVDPFYEDPRTARDHVGREGGRGRS